MESTRGEGRCRKRRCINATRSSPTQTEHGKTVVLPAEMWRRILLNLWYDEEDQESIFNCRLVSHSFKGVVDTLPPKLYWDPWMKFSEHNPYRYLESSLATNLRSDREISEFLQSPPPPNSAADGENPFRIHQTVRLFKVFGIINEKKDELKNILLIHGPFIKKLIFTLTNFVPKRLSTLSRILPSMVNLQTLIIDACCFWDEWEKGSNNRYPTSLNKLSEFVIAKSFLSRNNDNSMFCNLADTYGAQIKHLTLSLADIVTDSSYLLEKFPNLVELKVEKLIVNKSYLETRLFGDSWPRLRRLALGLRDCEDDSIGFKNVVKLITLFSSTLELLSLDVGRQEEPDDDVMYRFSKKNDEDEDVQYITPFPQLKKMILPFCFVSRSQQTLEERFNFDFSQLKVVILQYFEEKFQTDEISKVELRRICRPLWRLVPPSVDTICVRTDTWKEHLGMRVSVLYKCSRTPAV